MDGFGLALRILITTPRAESHFCTRPVRHIRKEASAYQIESRRMSKRRQTAPCADTELQEITGLIVIFISSVSTKGSLAGTAGQINFPHPTDQTKPSKPEVSINSRWGIWVPNVSGNVSKRLSSAMPSCPEFPCVARQNCYLLPRKSAYDLRVLPLEPIFFVRLSPNCSTAPPFPMPLAGRRRRSSAVTVQSSRFCSTTETR